MEVPRVLLAPMVLMILAATLQDVHTKKIPKWWMKVAQKQGPNACVVEEVPGTGKEFWTECRYWLNRKICGRKTIVRFECCEGFEQIEGENGCTRVKPLINLLDTATALGATRWAAYIRESGLANELESAGAYTLFAPTNEAFDNAKASVKSQLEAYRGNPNNPVLLYHIVPTKLPSDHFEANTVVETRHTGNFLRINKYSNGMNTINCALLLQKDQQATNGIVHVIDSVLDPSKSLPENVADMVLKDGRFSVLSSMLEKSGYINVLRTLQGAVTFLAPSDEAFQKLPDSRRQKIISDREARLALIQNHIIPHVICESAITGEHRVRTVSSNKLTFNCDIAGAYVETTKLRGNYNLGKNGIIHILDDVLLPDRAKNLVELAESRQLFTFAELVRNAGLEETLSHTGDYTFFVPDENAWFELDPAVLQQARRDVEYAGLLIRFHGAYGRHLTNAITDNQAIMSLDEENPVRLQVWRRAMGVEDAKITTPDVEAQNGVIHIINKVIFPANQTAIATMRSLPGRNTFNSYLDILQSATSQSPPVLSLRPEDETFYTFFAPSDEAFQKVDAETRARLRSGDKDVVTSYIKKHIAVNMFPYTSFEPNLIYSIEGMDGSNFNLKKDGAGQITVNGVPVMSSHMSANGVIHVIGEVFTPGSMYGSTSHSSSSRTSSAGGNTGSLHSSSSSSSSSSRGTATRRTETYRKTVTFAEGFDNANTRLLVLPQGSELATSVRGLPEIVSSSHATLSTFIHNSTTERTSTSSDGAASTYSPTQLHDVTHRQSDTHSSINQYNSNPNSRQHGNVSSTLYSPHDYEPGLDQWQRENRLRGVSSHFLDETYNENTRDLHDGTIMERSGRFGNAENEDSGRHESTIRTRLHDKAKLDRRAEVELTRPEYSARFDDPLPEEIVLQEEAERQLERDRHDELSRQLISQQELKRQAELRRREQQLEQERRQLIVRQRQDELRRQQEENARIEEENRLLEFENRRQEEIGMKHEKELRMNEDNRAMHGRAERIGASEVTRNGYRLSASHSRDGSRHRTGEAYGVHAPSSLLTHDTHGDALPGFARNNNDTITNTSTVTTRVSYHNTVGPVTPNGTRYSYVGRSYGDDIVGHNSNGIDYIKAGPSGSLGHTFTNEHISNTGDGGDLISNGISTTTTRRRVNVTRTIYSYPVSLPTDTVLAGTLIPSRNANINKARYVYHQQRPLYPNNADDKLSSDFISAYAFTGGDTEYADGEEFAESGAPVVATITVDEARSKHRQERRKHHHMQQRMSGGAAVAGDNQGSQRVRMRKARGKGMRKTMRYRQAKRRMNKERNQA